MTDRPRRIDHLVLAVHDLDAAAAGYERIGFQIGARNRHPWGTENRLIQFGSSFVELITVADAADIPPHTADFFSFGAYVRDFLGHRQGVAMFVLDSPDARLDAERFASRGIGRFQPFFFERNGRGPDGSTTQVSFSLAFARDERLPEASFFVCQQHQPQAFWNPLFQHHPNGATTVTSVVLEVGDPLAHLDFLSAFTGAQPTDRGRRYSLANGGRLRVRATSGAPGFSTFRIGADDLGLVRRRLAAADLSFQRLPHRVVIGADDCFGATVEFEERPDESRRDQLPDQNPGPVGS